ncbi:hypothetical protein GGTG_13090 [Gaeumannomyces tritici R3-111a-1]|uniref:Uncharacterized protein n=1 Tax=Gaeumannomyces tritici (strain R3-111a-1) TaxID=644352 RepID=J3PHV9_GAET3|nr:hypothetical protein GGTG_13090 [Gaeumannomyces tritici R3-111a-1]EJT69471.1 hypothetical protein GGTG_13090 [Gaeumannomyces tritici R3-111a-1]
MSRLLCAFFEGVWVDRREFAQPPSSGFRVTPGLGEGVSRPTKRAAHGWASANAAQPLSCCRCAVSHRGPEERLTSGAARGQRASNRGEAGGRLIRVGLFDGRVRQQRAGRKDQRRPERDWGQASFEARRRGTVMWTKQRQLGKPGPKPRPLTGKGGGGNEAKVAGARTGEARPGRNGGPVEGRRQRVTRKAPTRGDLISGVDKAVGARGDQDNRSLGGQPISPRQHPELPGFDLGKMGPNNRSRGKNTGQEHGRPNLPLCFFGPGPLISEGPSQPSPRHGKVGARDSAAAGTSCKTSSAWGGPAPSGLLLPWMVGTRRGEVVHLDKGASRGVEDATPTEPALRAKRRALEVPSAGVSSATGHEPQPPPHATKQEAEGDGDGHEQIGWRSRAGSAEVSFRAAPTSIKTSEPLTKPKVPALGVTVELRSPRQRRGWRSCCLGTGSDEHCLQYMVPLAEPTVLLAGNLLDTTARNGCIALAKPGSSTHALTHALAQLSRAWYTGFESFREEALCRCGFAGAQKGKAQSSAGPQLREPPKASRRSRTKSSGGCRRGDGLSLGGFSGFSSSCGIWSIRDFATVDDASPRFSFSSSSPARLAARRGLWANSIARMRHRQERPKGKDWCANRPDPPPAVSDALGVHSPIGCLLSPTTTRWIEPSLRGNASLARPLEKPRQQTPSSADPIEALPDANLHSPA